MFFEIRKLTIKLLNPYTSKVSNNVQFFLSTSWLKTMTEWKPINGIQT